MTGRKYQPAVPISEMSKMIGVKESTIRKYIKENKIDRRGDNARIKLDKVRDYKAQHKYTRYPSAAIARELGMSYNTLKKYWNFKSKDEIATEFGKAAAYVQGTLEDTISSVAYDVDTILQSIHTLYMKGLDKFDADLTYGKGTFYKGKNMFLEPPKGGLFDMYPKNCPLTKDVQALSILPTDKFDLKFNSVIADPPHHIQKKGTKGDNNYNMLDSYDDICKAYRTISQIAIHTIKAHGIFVLTAPALMNADESILEKIKAYIADHFKILDIFILVDKNIPKKIAPTEEQPRSYKSHSYFLVFEKREKPWGD